MPKKIRMIFFCILIAWMAQARAFELVEGQCDYGFKLIKRACLRLHQIWYEGSTDLLLSGYAWHNRYTYSAAKIKTYNEKAYGGGLGRTIRDEDGDLHGLFAFGFSDSHKNFEPVVGYGYLKNWRFHPGVDLGLGLTALVTVRRDINKGAPLPGVLPLLGLGYQRLTLFATYIPGSMGAGNVLYAFGKWQITGD